MDFQGNNNPLRGSIGASVDDQQFLVNFIMSTYLGPDVYSDNPRCSASQRLAEGFPPYTSKNLGHSFISISQLESLYYYVLRNAHPSLVLEPKKLHMYLKGNLPFPSSAVQLDCRQFPSFFPLNIHEQKKYSASNEIVKGIVLIDDPVTSFKKEDDLERFRYLSGMDGLKIDKIKSLCYQHGYQKSEEEGEQNCKKNSGATGARCISNGNNNESAKFQEKRKRRHCSDPLPMPPFPPVVSMSKNHGTCESDGPAMMPLLTIPNVKECTSDASIILNGTVRKGIPGPQVGVVDIGVSKAAYFFRVALPGVRRDYCQFSCEIESDGKVHIQGSTSGGRTIRKRSRVFQMKFRQLCPPGLFTLSFSLPGPVDPRLFSPNFRSDGIFEAVIIKHK